MAWSNKLNSRNINNQLDSEIIGISPESSKLQRQWWSKYEKERLKDYEGYLKAANKIELGYLTDIEKTKKQKRQEELDERLKNLRMEYEMSEGYAKKKAEAELKRELKRQSLTEQAAKQASKTLSNLSNVVNSAVNSVENYMGTYANYMTGIEARIQGSGNKFSKMTDLIAKNIGASPFVKQTAVLENLNKLVEQGISYNVEQRAFLETVSDSIATTFSAFDSSLLRLIKIQQADSTEARLGLESTLTYFFNDRFKDTSYLNGLSKSISEAIIGASSQLGRDGALQLESTVQSWLGSMSSVGVGDSILQSLAQGINALGTGDVNSLTNNSALQNLLVLGANAANLDYSRILTGGLTPETANALLGGIVKYTQSIAGIENQVVRSQYANLFGMTVADLTAILNLSSSDLAAISQNMITYSQATAEVANQLQQIPSRMMLKTKIDTAIDNIMMAAGVNIANNAGSYVTYMIADMVEKATGGINIPFVNAMGFGVDLNATVEQLIKTGIVGWNVLSQTGSILAALSGKNKLSASGWNAEASISRGAGFSGIQNTGLTTTTSQTQYVGNSSESDLYEGSVLAAGENAQSVTGKEEDDTTKSIETIIRDSIDINIASIAANTDAILTLMQGNRGLL